MNNYNNYNNIKNKNKSINHHNNNNNNNNVWRRLVADGAGRAREGVGLGLVSVVEGVEGAVLKAIGFPCACGAWGEMGDDGAYGACACVRACSVTSAPGLGAGSTPLSASAARASASTPASSSGSTPASSSGSTPGFTPSAGPGSISSTRSAFTLAFASSPASASSNCASESAVSTHPAPRHLGTGLGTPATLRTIAAGKGASASTPVPPSASVSAAVKGASGKPFAQRPSLTPLPPGLCGDGLRPNPSALGGAAAAATAAVGEKEGVRRRGGVLEALASGLRFDRGVPVLLRGPRGASETDGLLAAELPQSGG
eukprot:CAMPEP_0179851966 /NCGR_PEP_ID=MMETSP0982-20121206/8543_1 /TAXON_ID=483367 /ORGANISM="non described non described, Strain CCMP 2436" /LENGTH=313 /DNA_ID=CAMNT_0021737543 /DNA_START=736 /DNA_END=1673 /DNA_ORIENTATION=+